MGSSRLATPASLLDRFETEHGIMLPLDFRAYLLEDHPALERGVFLVDAEHRSIVSVYRFRADLLLIDIAARRGALLGIVPDDLLAFARCNRGDLLCIGVRGPRQGGVFLVKLPRLHRLGPAPRAIAASFTAFLDQVDVGWGDLPTGVHPLPRSS